MYTTRWYKQPYAPNTMKHAYSHYPSTPPPVTEYRRVREENNGPIGLSNLGNTCFMNAALQCLVATQGFCGMVAMEKPRDPTKIDLLEAFQTMTADIQAARRGVVGRDRVVVPRGVKTAIGGFNPTFMGYGQHDAQEFLRFMLEGLHQEVNRNRGKPHYEQLDDVEGEQVLDTSSRWWAYTKKRDDSVVYDTFGGQLMSSVTCTVCETPHLAFDPFLDLSVPIPKVTRTPAYRMSQKHDLTDCLRRFCDTETLDGHDRFHCRKCKTQTRSVKQLQIMRSPEYLLVHLLRFNYGCYKLSDDVSIPHELDLKPYISPSSRSLPENLSTQYSLYGVINHSGGLGSGHYTSLVSSPSGSWHSCDDSYVAQVAATPVVSGDKPYILFYKKNKRASIVANSEPPLFPRRDISTPGKPIRTPQSHF
eukprot:TRINITY_DN3675_c0_g1_i1.p1 TRINITY_DN3675_c0_g1~~TRINITY_DN3675_c0_g1_i1.p1  ORF type:complete len:419 (+),score=54.69 TRINITY_DN3675_c0_g1_i1:35-1291(+)